MQVNNLSPSNIDNTIEQIEKLYARVTGKSLPANNGNQSSQINPEMDPSLLVDARLHQLLMTLSDPIIQARLQPFAPAVSIWESDEKILLRMDLCGVRKEDIDISVRGNALIISGFRNSVQPDVGFTPRHQELPFGQFFRSINLPLEVTPSEIDSKLEDGTLQVFVSKRIDSAKTQTKKGPRSTQ